ncbi:DUF5689 domain-containing protein [Niabella drilacis]|uniref:DUF5689 domain-containing protein n=1 Tax=Niabella drilacis (strain DSM 25811 / CCM 8410 / CCUG 62505 / LMG 26954 / E90) TaxID=1285928 RepID=A0A1G6XCN3_NIADE|nr:DUF5689 domain-containing protein [Niabella drilacis]SDD75553.1 hypothetical protein SAMN04487894_11316 [Niabella drilacis]
MKLKYFKHIFIVLFVISLTSCFKKDTNYALGTVNEEASIYVLRKAFKGSPVTLSADNLAGAHIVAGVVISRSGNKNFPQGYIALESVWRNQVRGILIAVPDAAKYQFGDSLRIDVSGAKMEQKEYGLEVNNISDNRIEKVPGVSIAKVHRPVSIGTIEKDPDAYESTLISVTADVSPDPVTGEPFKGTKAILDGEGKTIEVYTEDGAVFADEKIAPSASFQGVLLQRDHKLSLRMQSYDDMMYPSGKLYQGWPETFEDPYQTKTSYNMTAINNLVTMPTGIWYMLQCIQGNTAGRDRIVSGKQAVRFQQNLSSSALLQMNFDVPDGASKVTVWYGSYYTDRSCTFRLEYSTDQGVTWHKTGNDISDAHSTAVSLTAKQAVFLMDIQGPVRFRINKLGLGTSDNTISNGRLGLDDFAIYKAY